jgi:hypothetical protein
VCWNYISGCCGFMPSWLAIFQLVWHPQKRHREPTKYVGQL